MRPDLKEFLLDMLVVACCLYVVAQAVKVLILFI